MSRARFVAANVALRALGEESDSTRRAQVLARYRVTEDDLRAWVRAHGGDPQALAETWEVIAHRTDSLALPLPPPQPAGAPGVPRPDESDVVTDGGSLGPPPPPLDMPARPQMPQSAADAREAAQARRRKPVVQ